MDEVPAGYRPIIVRVDAANRIAGMAPETAGPARVA
jgi:hypothetical protein